MTVAREKVEIFRDGRCGTWTTKRGFNRFINGTPVLLTWHVKCRMLYMSNRSPG